MSTLLTNRRLTIVALWLLALLVSLAPRADAQNVVVITIDDLGWEDMNNMPLLNSITPFGQRHDQFYSSTLCSSTRYMRDFSRWNFDAGIGSALSLTPNNEYMRGAPTEHVSLAEVMGVNGYRTALFGKWHISGLSTVTSNDGPRIHGYQTQGAMNMTNLMMGSSHYNWMRTDDEDTTATTQYSSDAIRESFCDWWLATDGKKFAEVNFFAPHEPYVYPPGMSGPATNRARYEAMIQDVDQQIFSLASVLDLSSTYVIIMSDNGTPNNALPPNPQFQGYKTTIFQGGIRVPMFIFGPTVVPGIHCDLVSVVDIARFVVDFVGVTPHSDWIGVPIGQRQYHLGHWFLPNSGTLPSPLNQERWAVVRSDGFKLNHLGDLYNVFTDPFELFPLSDPSTEMDLQAFYDSVVAP